MSQLIQEEEQTFVQYFLCLFYKEDQNARERGPFSHFDACNNFYLQFTDRWFLNFVLLILFTFCKCCDFLHCDELSLNKEGSSSMYSDKASGFPGNIHQNSTVFSLLLDASVWKENHTCLALKLRRNGISVFWQLHYYWICKLPQTWS